MAHELGHFSLNPWEDTMSNPSSQGNYTSTYGTPAQVQGFGNMPSFTLPSSQSLMNSGATINPDMFKMRTPSRMQYGGGGSSGMFSGLGKVFTADNMNAFGSAVGGLGQLASGWAALKNISLQKDAYDTMKNQWERNYGDKVTIANNQIADRNAWRDANNMTTTANYVG